MISYYDLGGLVVKTKSLFNNPTPILISIDAHKGTMWNTFMYTVNKILMQLKKYLTSLEMRLHDWFGSPLSSEYHALENLLLQPSTTQIWIENETVFFEHIDGKKPAFRFKNTKVMHKAIECLCTSYRIIQLSNGLGNDSVVYLQLSPKRMGALIRTPSSSALESVLIKFSNLPPTSLQDYLRYHTLSDEIIIFLRHLMDLGARILIVGNFNSGKGSFLRALAIQINSPLIHWGEFPLKELSSIGHHYLFQPLPADETRARIVRTLSLSKRSAFVIDECLGAESWDILNIAAKSTTFITTIAGETIEDGFAQLEQQCLLAPQESIQSSVRTTIGSAFDYIIQIKRLNDGARKITRISKLNLNQNQNLELDDLFLFKKKGLDKYGRITGDFVAINKTTNT